MRDAPLVATPTSVRMAVEYFRGFRKSSELDDVDEAAEDLTVQAPAMFMAHSEEKEARRDALYKAVLDAEEHVLSKEGN